MVRYVLSLILMLCLMAATGCPSSSEDGAAEGDGNAAGDGDGDDSASDPQDGEDGAAGAGADDSGSEAAESEDRESEVSEAAESEDNASEAAESEDAESEDAEAETGDLGGSCSAEKTGMACGDGCSFAPAEVDCEAACAHIEAICAGSECSEECEGQMTDASLCALGCNAAKSLYCANEVFGCYAANDSCGGVAECLRGFDVIE